MFSCDYVLRRHYFLIFFCQFLLNSQWEYSWNYLMNFLKEIGHYNKRINEFRKVDKGDGKGKNWLSSTLNEPAKEECWKATKATAVAGSISSTKQ
jgi:hypothetical protein